MSDPLSSPIDDAIPFHLKTQGQLQVIKRNGQAVPFDGSKIANAMTKAFLAVEGQEASGSTRVRSAVTSISEDILQRIQRRLPSGGSVDIEDIQDLVELGMMRLGFQKVARAYVLYREEQKLKRAEQVDTTLQPADELNTLQILSDTGEINSLNLEEVDVTLQWACQGIEDVDVNLLCNCDLP